MAAGTEFDPFLRPEAVAALNELRDSSDEPRVVTDIPFDGSLHPLDKNPGEN